MDPREPPPQANMLMRGPTSYTNNPMIQQTPSSAAAAAVTAARFSFNHPAGPLPQSQTESQSKHLESFNSGGFDGLTSSRSGGFGIDPSKKKRGRPRKYTPDGNIALRLSTSQSPGSRADSGGGGGDGGSGVAGSDYEHPAKRNRGRPPGSGKKQLDALGGVGGVGFTPHVITGKAGEDIASKIVAFSQQGPRTVCILSASGAISNVTLRQPAMSGGTVTYEGNITEGDTNVNGGRREGDTNYEIKETC